MTEPKKRTTKRMAEKQTKTTVTDEPGPACCAASGPDSSRPGEAPDGKSVPTSRRKRSSRGDGSPTRRGVLDGHRRRKGLPRRRRAGAEGTAGSLLHRPLCPVTNAKFSEFIEVTDYETEAERFGWSFVFYQFLTGRAAGKVKGVAEGAPWWRAVEGVSSRLPEGPDSDIKDRLDHLAVHISYNDAISYCERAGKRLPTEAEWEYGARGGLKQRRYPWETPLRPEASIAATTLSFIILTVKTCCQEVITLSLRYDTSATTICVIKDRERLWLEQERLWLE
jgi:sulfatase modifying factor 1